MSRLPAISVHDPHSWLSPELVTRASLDGKEWAWPMSDVPAVIAAARDNGFATLGGQIQFRCPTGTYEFYWLNADSGDRRPAETWQEYVARSAEDVMTGSGSLPQTVEALMPEINAWPALAAGHRAGLELGRYLCFVLYFHDETEAA